MSPKFQVGPGYKGDSAFQARMRLHQGWYRANALNLPWGVGPTRNSTRELCNMLRFEHGESGYNFFPLQEPILSLVHQRIAAGPGVEPFRVKCNMLSSQPMCFNLFGFLKTLTDEDLKARLVEALLPEQVRRVTRIEIENPIGANSLLGDHTSFDAFIEYSRKDGGEGFVGIETKLTEPFSPKLYRLVDRESYAHWTRNASSPWPMESWGHVDEIAHNQLWRNHMLVTAMRLYPDSRHTSGFCMLVRHPGDEACSGIVANYRQLLKPSDGTFLDWPLDRLMDAWQPLLWESKHKDWLGHFILRYLDLDASQPH